MKVACYPGSFDPLTMGHLDIIHRSVAIFDRLVVGIIHNPNKKSTFPLEKRKEMVKKVLKAEKIEDKIIVDSFDGLLVDYLKKNNLKIIVRGLRATTDFEYEMTLALMNKELYPEAETFFLMANTSYSFISSNLIREVFSFGGDISRYVHPIILEEMMQLRK